MLFNDFILNFESIVEIYVNVDNGVVDIKVVFEGVCYILMECFVEDVVLLVKICCYFNDNVYICSCVVEG